MTTRTRRSGRRHRSYHAAATVSSIGMWACAGADQVRLAAIVAAGLRQHRGAATAVLDGVNQVEVLQLWLFADHNPDVQADCSPADLDILSRVIVPFHAVS